MDSETMLLQLAGNFDGLTIYFSFSSFAGMEAAGLDDLSLWYIVDLCVKSNILFFYSRARTSQNRRGLLPDASNEV